MTHKSLPERDRFRRFWLDNLLFGAATLLAGILNYFFSVALAQGLGPIQFGNVTTLINVTSVLFIAIPVVNLIATRVGKGPNRHRFDRWCWAVGFAFWLLVWAMQNWLTVRLHLTPGLLVVYGAAVVPSLVTAANLGYLQRARQYFWVGLLGVADAALGVLSALGALETSHPLAILGLGLNGFAWIIWGVSQWRTRHVPVASGAAPPGRLIYGTLIMGVISQIWLIADGIAAKDRLTAVAAGQYNGLATIGHSVPFVAASLAMVMLTAILEDPLQSRRYLVVTLGIYAGLATLGQALFMAVPHELVRVVLGSRYQTIAGLLGLYGWGMLAMGGLEILVAFTVAAEQWLLGFPLLIGTAIWCWRLLGAHTSANLASATARMMVGTGVVALFVLYLHSAFRRCVSNPAEDSAR